MAQVPDPPAVASLHPTELISWLLYLNYLQLTAEAKTVVAIQSLIFPCLEVFRGLQGGPVLASPRTDMMWTSRKRDLFLIMFHSETCSNERWQ